MRTRLVLLAGVAAFGLWGCSSEAIAVPTYRGTPGAGLTAEIVGIVRDSTGYVINVKVTNLDVAPLDYGPHSWRVDVLINGSWVPLASNPEPDDMLDLGLQPGQTIPNSLPVKTLALAHGTEVRVITGSRTTAPVAIQ